VRFRPELAACLVLMAAASPAWCAPEALTRQQIEQAIETVRADPNLETERTQRQLVWDSDEKPRDRPSGNWWEWLSNLFSWIGQASQMLMWLVIAALVAFLVLLLLRLLSKGGPASRGTRNHLAPTHVRDLDIRPESLPPDIGAAARRLWEAGEHRAALALLYRGMLSRLAHTFAIPIRDSSTEGDCLALAARVLDARRLEYTTRLVRTWQIAIYAGRQMDDRTIFELCDGFDAHLPAAAEDSSAPRATLANGAGA
jgi:hypothetical protein